MELEGLSYEHRLALEFCFNLRKDLEKKRNPQKLKALTTEFYNKHLKEHFAIEEKFIFPIMGEAHPAVKQALKEHRSISLLCTMSNISLLLIEQFISELDAHIRFEERVILAFVKNNATADQLKKIEEMHQAKVLTES